ncbi:NHL repeats containing protein [Chitinispirillum alkaliphilum]|nr:NHL repeats containing protein [Chitinispirillum alkaliphilum]
MYLYNTKTGDSELLSDSRRFPDPYLTSIISDKRGNIWIGSRNGYLYKRTPEGVFHTFSNYNRAGWGILDIYPHNDLLIIGSQRGCSVFDTKKGVALKNSAAIGSFSNPRVNKVTLFRDTLYLGCEEGVAVLTSDISRANFYDRTVWRTVQTDSAVVDFQIRNRELIPSSVPVVSFKNQSYSAMGGMVMLDSVPALDFGERETVTALYNDGNNHLWVGTDDQFFFGWDGQNSPYQIKIEGLPLKNINRIYAAKNGDVWLLPAFTHTDGYQPWYTGIIRFDGSQWDMYNSYTFGNYSFGNIGYGNMTDIAEDRSGHMWVGTWGGNVKKIDPAQNNVSQLYIGEKDDPEFGYYTEGGFLGFGLSRALSTDSNGFLWISVHDHNLGSLVCYDPGRIPDDSRDDPLQAGFRRFFPKESPYHADYIKLIEVDRDNRIFLVDSRDRLLILEYSGNPLERGITVRHQSTSLGIISDIAASPDGRVYVASTNGLYTFLPNTTTPVKLKSSLGNTNSIAVQNENVFWIGTNDDGLIRGELHPYRQDSVSLQFITTDNGILSNSIVDISVNREKGLLWVATDAGVSKLYLGSQSRLSSDEKIEVFPNPYSVSNRHQGADRITFSKLEPRSTVSLYSVDGQLVAQLESERISDYEWQSGWRPPQDIVPGTYVVLTRPSGKKAKLLILP